MKEKVQSLKGKLIVSCQALPHEPLHSSFIMGRMAVAAKEGGACGIRANTKEDISEIQSNVDLPIIGIVKRDYADSKVYITPGRFFPAGEGKISGSTLDGRLLDRRGGVPCG